MLARAQSWSALSGTFDHLGGAGGPAIAGTHVVARVYPPSPQLETTLPPRVDVMPLYVVDTVQEEPLTVRVEDRPPCENIPSGWQTQEESPASFMLEQHVCAPLPPPPLLLLHAPTSPTNRTTQADVIRFIDPDPTFDGQRSISLVRDLG